MISSPERTKGTSRFSFKSINELKANKSEDFTIYLFFTYGKKRLKFSTGLKTNYNDWDFTKQRFKNRAHLKNKDSDNSKLSKIEDSIQKVYNELSGETSNITPKFLKNRLQLKLKDEAPKTKQNQKLTFSELADKFIEYKEGNIKAVTLRSYKQARTHLKSFESYKGKLYELDEINAQFHKDFVKYLQEKKKFTKNTIGKHIKTIKTFMNFALTEGYSNNQSFKSSEFNVSKEITTEIYLTHEEIEAFRNHDLSKYPKLSHARDIFLIGYYTGQRVSDYNSFKEEDIQTINGQDYFVIVQQKNKKNGRKVYCPITKEIREIMDERHNGLPPERIPDKDINDYIKQVGQMLDVESLHKMIKCEYTKAGKQVVEILPKHKLIKSHTARRSFATNMYKAGMNVYDIMLFTGHTTEKEFYKYIRIKDEERVSHVLKSGFFNV
jgi:site-specific recombinase XerD